MKVSQKQITVYEFDDGFYVEVSKDEDATYFYLGHTQYGVKSLMFGVPDLNLMSADQLIEANIEEQAAAKKNQEKVEQKKESTIKVGSLVLDLEKYEVHIDGKVINLTLREFEVLKFLAQQPGQVVTRESLLERVWGYEYYGDIRTVDVTVRRIRERIENDTSNPQILITKRGVGYYIPNK